MYVPLHCHSSASLLDGLPSPLQIAKRAKEIGAPACAITDHGNISAMLQFYKACKKLDIKPIIGMEAYVCQFDPSIQSKENKKLWHLTILAKNDQGIKDLIELVSLSNDPAFFYRKPRLDLDHLKLFGQRGNLICLSGCLAGELSSSLFTDVKRATVIGEQSNSQDKVKEFLNPRWKNICVEIIEKYQKAFGKENFYLEIQKEGMPSQQVVVDCLRQAAKGLNISSVCSLDSHYCKQTDVEDHRILLYSQLHTTASDQERAKQSGKDTMAFFYRDTFYIFNYEEMKQHYTDQEIETTLEIADCINYSGLGRHPCLPKFIVKDKSSDQHIRDLCIQSAKLSLGNLPESEKLKYWQRLEKELLIIKEANLSDYFLIVWDACKFLDSENAPRGKGRGSGAGSLVNYLLNITQIDPIKYGLYFERFYNASRNIPAHFDLAEPTFMSWMSDNFEKLLTINTNKYKNLVRSAINKNRIKNRKILQKEAQWIDHNNPKMWIYIGYIYTQYKKAIKNPNNSHIAYAIGLTDELNDKKMFKYNKSHISLPDIDVDIGIEYRQKLIDYLINKWGSDKVSQMVTFGRLQGKAALKEVFRAQPDVVKHLMQVRAVKLGKNPNDINISPYDLVNEITKLMPDEASIADELQQIRKETKNDVYGILNWSIDNIDQMKKYYEFYQPLFDQAMRLEGTKKNQSKHAAGVVIASEPIDTLVPLIFDPQSKTRIIGFEMEDAQEMGCVKFDWLGVGCLDKIWAVQDCINDTTQESKFVDKPKRKIMIENT